MKDCWTAVSTSVVPESRGPTCHSIFSFAVCIMLNMQFQLHLTFSIQRLPQFKDRGGGKTTAQIMIILIFCDYIVISGLHCTVQTQSSSSALQDVLPPCEFSSLKHAESITLATCLTEIKKCNEFTHLHNKDRQDCMPQMYIKNVIRAHTNRNSIIGKELKTHA